MDRESTVDTVATRIGSLYEQYWRPIFAFLRARLPLCDPVEIEDLTAMVFERALRALPAYREEGRSGAWLRQIARSVLADRGRRGAARPQTVALDPDVMDVPVEYAPDDLVMLAEALGQILPRHRLALVEHYLLGAPDAETALLLGISEPAVRGLRLRALNALRRQMLVA